MRRALQPLLAVLLTACAAQPQPVPDTLAKRYRAFVQEVKLPLGLRLSRYLGPVDGELQQKVGTEEALTVRFAPTNEVSEVTIRIDNVINGVYVGRMWTQFNRKAACISLWQLSEVGRYEFGLPIHVHGHGPNNWYGVVRLEFTPDKFFLFLEDGASIEGVASFERGCLDRLEHSVALRTLEW